MKMRETETDLHAEIMMLQDHLDQAIADKDIELDHLKSLHEDELANQRSHFERMLSDIRFYHHQ